MVTFSFGRNWKRFVRHVVNDEILQYAQDSLRNFLGNDFNFKDKVFLDVGCGSGLFSLAALRLGAHHIISIDIDKDSIEATQMLQEKFCHLIPQEICWEVLEGNILDKDFIDSLRAKLQEIGKDIVLYSWGVLHHTGNLSLAMNHAMNLASYKYAVGGGGQNYVYIALYNKTEASAWWHDMKKKYNNTNSIMKFIMVFFYTCFLTFEDIRKGRGLNMYDKKRGMYKITDIIDWLGGMPYEPIENDGVIDIWTKNNFELVKNNPTVYYSPTYPMTRFYRLFVFLKVVGLGCNEFLFKTNHQIPIPKDN